MPATEPITNQRPSSHVGRRRRGWVSGRTFRSLAGVAAACLVGAIAGIPAVYAGATQVSIRGEDFLINGRPTYEGRTWKGAKIEGLLLNARLVQGVFDDLNPGTSHLWAYPDTQRWDADRNTDEFVRAMPRWRERGLLAFTLGLQGGSPFGYSKAQAWHNSAFEPDGALRADYRRRAERILDRADELGMVVILGLFYFGQDERLRDEAAVVRAVDETLAWLARRDDRHVLIEVNNECDILYDHAILRPARVGELIRRVQRFDAGGGRHFPAGTSFSGGKLPTDDVLACSDFVLLHGNGVGIPRQIAEMVRAVRARLGAEAKPILFNEDDHFDFDRESCHLEVAVRAHASWGYFDYRMKNEGFAEGFQSVPVDWTIDSERKRAFFAKIREISGLRETRQR